MKKTIITNEHMRRFNPLIIAIALCLSGCDRSRETPEFVNSTGTFLFDGQMTIDVVETQDGGINYTVTRGMRTVGPSNPPIRKGSGWFLHAASPDEVWMYDGESNVQVIEFLSDKESKSSDIKVVPDLLQRAPAAFVERLPAHLTK
ncbi:hypothetical protein BH23VER1_BH23VER1_21060 [soil metagenome]